MLHPLRILLSALVLLAFTREEVAATSYTWNGSTSTAWNTATNWSPNGIPTATDNVTIGSTTRTPLLDASRSVTAFTLSASSLDLNGFTLTVAGNASLTNGTISNGNLVCNGTTTSFGSTSTTSLTIQANLTVSSATVLLQRTLYSGTVAITKTGSSTDNSVGGNTFQGLTTLRNTGAGSLRMGASSLPDVFNADLTLSNEGTGDIKLAQTSNNNRFNGDILLNSTSGLGIQLCNPNVAAVGQLANGKRLLVGSRGFSAGELTLGGLTQLGTTAQSLILSGSATIRMAFAAFNGAVNFKAAKVGFTSCTFNSDAVLVNLGSTTCFGGNTFNGTTTLVNQGYLVMGYYTGDTFNGDLTLTNQGPSSGSGGITLVYNTGAVTRFNGNVVVNNPVCYGTIDFAWAGANGRSELAAGKTITVGPLGYCGTLALRGLTQFGNTPQTITTVAHDIILHNSTFEGPVNFRATYLKLQGSTFKATAYLQKLGGVADVCVGGNTFYQATTIVNSSTGNLILANTSPDEFRGDVTFSNTNTAGLYVAHTAANTWFKGPVTVSSTNGLGVLFGANGGSSQLASGKTLQTSGFSAGQLALSHWTQADSTAQSLTLTGSASLLIGAGCTFGGPVSFTAPSLWLNGAVFQREALFTKTGNGVSHSQGGNTFYRKMQFINRGSSAVNLATTTDNLIH